MKKYIIISSILSILGHSLFFSIFKVGPNVERNKISPQLFLISKEQFDYIKEIGINRADKVISIFPVSLLKKNNLWSDKLDITKTPDIVNINTIQHDNEDVFEDIKACNFKEVVIPLDYYTDIAPLDLVEEYVPMFGELLIQKPHLYNVGDTIKLNGLTVEYYIQGPISSRGLIFSNIEGAEFNIDRFSVRAKIRFWVKKDGYVNQAVIEESSSFPAIDSGLVNLIKKWRFEPIYNTIGPNYEWGIITVRIHQ